LISLDPNSFDRMEDYLACVKKIQLKLGECGKNYEKKYVQLIGLFPMKLRTPFNVFVSNFYTNCKAPKENGKDYTFEYFCGFFIIDHHIFLGEGKLGGKHQAYLRKGKGKMDPRNRERFDASTLKHAYHD